MHCFYGCNPWTVPLAVSFLILSYKKALNLKLETFLAKGTSNLLLCIEKSGICNFADENILYASGENIGYVVISLEVDIETVL